MKDNQGKISNVRALRVSDISPQIIVQSLENDCAKFKDIYVVAIDHEGEALIYASGDMSQAALAALHFQNIALKYLNGEISE